MRTQDLSRLSELWDELSDVAPTDREVWLCRLPHSDQAHASQLRRMLAESADGITAGAPPMTLEADGIPCPELSSGQRIGRYALKHLLGRGGMGEVWLAETSEGPANRLVALKLPLMGTTTSAARLRFERECAILAALRHPEIATLYEAGTTPEGQAYLAMEYVEGRTLLTFAQEERLTLRQRVELVVRLAEALGHAHQRLIIHRDIKPSNVLVTVDGKIKLLDFGIAKALEEDSEDAALLTQWAGSAVTLEYAAPEQIEAQALTTAVDVHALGIVLYELLCGARPAGARRRKRTELQAFIVGGHRPLPSSLASDEAARDCGLATQRALARHLRGDLDTILCCAVARDPSARYPGAAALAEDLRRWLEQRPIQAKAPSAAYRAKKFVQRHRRGLAAAFVTGTALVGLTVNSALNAQQAQRQQQLADEQAQRASTVSRFLTELLGVNGRARLTALDARNRSARELLDDGLQRLRADTAMLPAVRFQLMNTLGSIYTEMGLVDTGAALAEERAKIAEQVFGTDSIEYGSALVDHARNLVVRGEAAQAWPLLKRAKEAFSRIKGNSEVLATAWVKYGAVAGDAGGRGFLDAGLAAQSEARPWLQYSHDPEACSQFLMNAGILELQSLQYGKAVATLREAVAKIDQLGPDERAKGFGVIGWLGHAELFGGFPAAARAHFEESVALADRTAVPVEEQWVYQGLWSINETMGEYERAWQSAGIAVAKIEQLPDLLVTPEMATPYLILAHAAARTGRVEAALGHLAEAQALRQRKAKYDGTGRAALLRETAAWAWVEPLLAAGDLTGAREALRADAPEAKGEMRISFRVLRYYLRALDVALAARDVSESRRLLNEMPARGILLSHFRIYHQWRLRLQTAGIRVLEKDLAGAESDIKQVLADIEGHAESDFWIDARLRAQRALLDLRLEQHRDAEASNIARALVREYDQRQAVGLSLDQMQVLRRLALAQARVGDRPAAEASLKRASAIGTRHPGLKLVPQEIHIANQLTALGLRAL